MSATMSATMPATMIEDNDERAIRKPKKKEEAKKEKKQKTKKKENSDAAGSTPAQRGFCSCVYTEPRSQRELGLVDALCLEPMRCNLVIHKRGKQ